MTLIMFAALSTAGCDKAANIASDIASEVAPPTTWELTDQADPMTGKRVVAASWEERIDEAVPLVIGKTDVVCDSGLEHGRLYIEVTTFDATTDEGNYVQGMPMRLDEEVSQKVQSLAEGLALKLMVGAASQKAVEISEIDKAVLEFEAKGAVRIKARINEGMAGDQTIESLGFIKDYNNVARIYPSWLESDAGLKIQKVRLSVPTEQGSPNYLIDFSEPAVRKVLEACPSAQSVAAENQTDEPAAQEAEAAAPEGTAADSPVFACQTPKHLILIDKDEAGALRYRSWNTPKSVDDTPDMEIVNGTEAVEGTGECRYTNYAFVTGDTEFALDDNVSCTEEEPPSGSIGSLWVYVGGEMKAQYWCARP